MNEARLDEDLKLLRKARRPSMNGCQLAAYALVL
jgi:hypothetical protein